MRLIYIAGSGRSGSTLLERALTSAEGVFGVGEIDNLWRSPLTELVCACGRALLDCPFWSAVLREAGIDDDWLASMKWLENHVVRNRFLVTQRFDLDRIRRRSELVRFSELQERLFSTVARLSQSEFVVDSSKAGPRAWALAAHSEPAIVHLYRNCADVMASWRARKFDRGLNNLMQRKGFAVAAADWIKVEHSLRFLARQYSVSEISYSDLVAEPRPRLTRLLEPISRELSRGVRWLSETSIEPSPDYHSINGNPDRFERSTITIKKRSPLADLSRLERAVCLGFGGAVGLLYRPTH
jgi:hypothetical protein